MKKYKVIGLMSGTSMDGLDIALCEIYREGIIWKYKIVQAQTLDYTEEQRNIFLEMFSTSAANLIYLDRQFGKYLGEMVNDFLNSHKLHADFIASHGHTIFHQPQKGYTFQAGCGATLSAVTGLPVINDFRSVDVAMGGQGAPLVPIGDKLLFSEYTMCLNLGGIANISFDNHDKRMAYDICPANGILNLLAARTGVPYDDKGKIASKGKVIPELLGRLSALQYYSEPFPKSLGKEWVDQHVIPLLDASFPVSDVLATCCMHISKEINKAVSLHLQGKKAKVLVTGGGAFNDYLIGLLKQDAGEMVDFIIPSKETIMFKEALVFAFLGVLRLENQSNALSAVTGAKKDNIGGAIYGNFSGLL